MICVRNRQKYDIFVHKNPSCLHNSWSKLLRSCLSCIRKSVWKLSTLVLKQFLRLCVCVTNLLQISVLYGETQLTWRLSATFLNVRWKSSGFSLLFAVYSASRIASGNRVCPLQLSLAGLCSVYSQLAAIASLYYSVFFIVANSSFFESDFVAHTTTKK